MNFDTLRHWFLKKWKIYSQSCRRVISTFRAYWKNNKQFFCVQIQRHSFSTINKINNSNSATVLNACNYSTPLSNENEMTFFAKHLFWTKRLLKSLIASQWIWTSSDVVWWFGAAICALVEKNNWDHSFSALDFEGKLSEDDIKDCTIYAYK